MILVSYYGDTHHSDTYDTLEKAREGARASCVADYLVAELSETREGSRVILGVVDSTGNFHAVVDREELDRLREDVMMACVESDPSCECAGCLYAVQRKSPV